MFFVIVYVFLEKFSLKKQLVLWNTALIKQIEHLKQHVLEQFIGRFNVFLKYNKLKMNFEYHSGMPVAKI